jgi:hypothetical protein
MAVFTLREKPLLIYFVVFRIIFQEFWLDERHFGATTFRILALIIIVKDSTPSICLMYMLSVIYNVSQ